MTLTLIDVYLGLTYLKLVLFDFIDYYYRFLILSLPPYLFGQPIFTITQFDKNEHDSDYDSDDTEANRKMTEYSVFVSQLLLVVKKDNAIETTTLNGAQLIPFIDDKGRFFIGHIQQYYKDLDIIILKYIKVKNNQPSGNQSSDESIIRVIDVVKRYDIRNKKSVSFGVFM